MKKAVAFDSHFDINYYKYYINIFEKYHEIYSDSPSTSLAQDCVERFL